jgi:glycosyltransferase involved in cell wall biosynthesis
MNSTIISIIIATRYCLNVLPNCLESIFQQTSKNYEILVADALSHDGTSQYLQIQSEKLTWWISEVDNGIYDAWNKAIPQAKGRWLLFIGADDRLASPNVIEKLEEEIERTNLTHHDLLYFPVELVDKSGAGILILGRPTNNVTWQIPHGMPFHLPHSGMLHRRTLFSKIGNFDSTFRVAGDYQFILRALNSNPDALFFIERPVLINKGAEGTSFTHAHVGIWETRLARKSAGRRGFTIFWLLIWLRARFRSIWR